jgi:type VI protein secretion system component Hcp
MSNDEKSKRPKREPAPAPAPAAKRAQTGEELSDDELESVAGGGVDVFAKIGDIKGESMNTDHKGEIEIESYSWGVAPPRNK